MTLSVLMSVYNSSAYLDEAIQSVLAQTHRDFQFVIIDDGSKDNSLEICQRYAKQDSRIKLIAHENWGAAPALNDGAAQASGEWLFRMDPDDVMMPNRIERQLVFLRENPDLAVAGSLVLLIDRNSRQIGVGRSPFTSRDAVKRIVAGPTLIGFHHPSIAMRKSAFTEVGGYRKQYWPAEDLDLWSRLADRGHMMLVQPEYLLKYRIHSSSITMSSGRWQVQTVDWVEESQNRRRAALAERTYEEFLSQRRTLPWPQRLNIARRTLSRTLYKRGIQQWSLRDFAPCFTNLGVAMTIDPSLFLTRALPRMAGILNPLRWIKKTNTRKTEQKISLPLPLAAKKSKQIPPSKAA